jgi:hypothetical protein
MVDSTRTAGAGSATPRKALALLWTLSVALLTGSAGCGGNASVRNVPSSGGSTAASGDSSGGIAGDASPGHAGGAGNSAGGLAGGGATGAGEAGSGGSASGDAGSNGDAGSSGDASDPLLRIVNWSQKKRLLTPAAESVVLEETLQSFLEAATPPTRIRVLTAKGDETALWSPPAGNYISDFARHPGGEFSVVLLADDRSVSVVRLAADLKQLALARISDPEAAHDPHASDAGVTDLFGNGLTLDPARIGALGETALVAVVSSVNAIIAYRIPFTGGSWGAPARTLVEPPVGLTPFLPIGGSFDTFGAMGAWFRCPLDIDEAGNTYLAAWAAPVRIRAHVNVFNDGLAPLPIEPGFLFTGDSDLLLTKLGPDGSRQWTRVVGSSHEDEPYALRARGGLVAVVGRSRRLPGFDNTAWDALVSVSRDTGELVGTRTFALADSSIALAVDRVPNGGWLLGGSDGWAQNPDGLSILQFGTKLLLQLDSSDPLAATPVRYPLEPGPRHNEIRSVLASASQFWFAGHEDGPIMHTGDGDPTQIHATGVLGVGELH